MAASQEIQALIGAIAKGDRRALAKAITLVESQKEEDALKAENLLESLLITKSSSMRVAVSGVPGVGKSTFIEALGMFLIKSLKKRVAVLAIDPTSVLSGGSILGDKTRMTMLSADENAFIRPSPSLGVLGGVSQRTHEAIKLCETAGYDVVIIETVGVGQSEFAAINLSDVFLLLTQPNSGDDLQNMKKGLLEYVHIIAVNKADGALKEEATKAQRLLQTAFSTGDNGIFVNACSALEGTGISDVWKSVEKKYGALLADDQLARLRADQASFWFKQEIESLVIKRIFAGSESKQALARLTGEIRTNQKSLMRAAREFVDVLVKKV